MFQKISQMRDAWNNGNYEEAGRLFWELVGELSGWSGRSAATEGMSARDKDEAVVALEGFQADVQASGRASHGGWLQLLIAALPALIEILKKL